MIFKKIYKKLFKKKGLINSYESQINIHESSIILEGSHYDFRIPPLSRLYITIGKECLIKSSFTFETVNGEIIIGNNVHIGGAHFICRSAITIEDDVTMAWGIIIYDHNSHSINWEQRKNDNIQCYRDYKNHNGNNIKNKNWEHVQSKPILICSKAWIGFDVTILKGVSIGEGAIIGAKSVVTKNVPAWTVVAGNPATVVKILKQPN